MTKVFVKVSPEKSSLQITIYETVQYSRTSSCGRATMKLRSAKFIETTPNNLAKKNKNHNKWLVYKFINLSSIFLHLWVVINHRFFIWIIRIFAAWPNKLRYCSWYGKITISIPTKSSPKLHDSTSLRGS